MSDSKLNVKKLVEEYQKLLLELSDQKEALQKEREKFPIRYMEKDDFEDWTLKAANLKHQSIRLFSLCAALRTSIDIDVRHTISHILVDEAEDFLKDRGFQKFTDSLRESVVSYHKEMKDLLKTQGRIEVLFDTVSRLTKAFETDETNLRVFANYKHKGGF